MINRFVFVPTEQAEKYALAAERRKLYKAAHDAKRLDASHGKHHNTSDIPMSEREFIVWDGEGPQDTGYSLLGNSKGDEICHPNLGTKECLDLFLESAVKYPQRIHVSFGFTYDVSNILRELTPRQLTRLKRYNHVFWKGYQIWHIPRKWFRIKYGHISIKIYDVQSFFTSTLVGALEKWSIGPFHSTNGVTSIRQEIVSDAVPTVSELDTLSEIEIVKRFKNLRSVFQFSSIDSIRIYMRLELKYTKILMEKLRETFQNAGYSPNSWHGPGALARMAFTRHDVYSAMAECPADVQIAARYAFVAGRFEPFLAGHARQRVYVADINSAYPYFCSQLPNLSKGKWRYGREYEPGKFAVYHVSYNAKPVSNRKVYPLPYRSKTNEISWPHRVESWYWAPEAELVANDPDATFIESWVFDEYDAKDKPFAFVLDYYHNRLLLKRLGNPAEYTFKLIINSIYGQLAQRVGWDRKTRKPPRTHQLEWAGFITSGCRALVYKQAILCGNDLISIDTDGIMSLKPFANLVSSDELGQWKLTEFEDGIFWQSGIYGLKEKGQWTKAKTRGIPKGTYEVEELLERLVNFEPLRLTKRVFLSYGLAVAQGNWAKMNTWMDEPHEYRFGDGNKRRHYTGSNNWVCRATCKVASNDDLHILSFMPTRYGLRTSPVPHSKPHSLPWAGTGLDAHRRTLIDLMVYDQNDTDDDWRIPDDD